MAVSVVFKTESSTAQSRKVLLTMWLAQTWDQLSLHVVMGCRHVPGGFSCGLCHALGHHGRFCTECTFSLTV